VGKAGWRGGGRTTSDRGAVSSITLRDCLRPTCAGIGGCCWNLLKGEFDELVGAEDDSKEERSTPLVPSTATQLLARQEAVSVKFTEAAPNRER